MSIFLNYSLIKRITLYYPLLHLVLITTMQSQTFDPQPSFFRTQRQMPLVSLATTQDFNVATYGAIKNDGLDDLAAIQAALNAAKAAATVSNSVRVVFENGTYDIMPSTGDNHSLFLSTATNIVVEGNGSEIRNHNPSIGFFEVRSCTNVIFKDLNFDYAVLPFTQGVVTSKNASNNTFTVRTDVGFPELTEPYFAAAQEAWGCLKDATGKLKAGANNLFPYLGVATTSFERTVRLNSPNSTYTNQIAVGDYFVQIARINGKTIFHSVTSRNITFLNINIYASPAGSFSGQENYETNIINCKVIPKPASGRVHSGNADIIHITGSYFGPWVQDCRFEAYTDDAVNLKHTKRDIMEVVSPTVLKIKFNLTTADKVIVFNPRTGTPLTTQRSITNVQNLGSNIFQITLDGNHNVTVVGEHQTGDKIYVTNRASESAVFRNTTFKNGRRYGILFQSSYAEVKNCTFENLSSSGIKMENGVDWGEGYIASNIQINNNNFINCGFDSSYIDDDNGAAISSVISKLKAPCTDTYTWCGTEPVTSQGITNITISNNSFLYNKTAINLQNIDGGFIANNAFTNNTPDITLNGNLPREIVTTNSSNISYSLEFDNNMGLGDSKWSTLSNWTGDALPTTFAIINANVNLDNSYSLTENVSSGLYTVSGAGKLTISGSTGVTAGLLSDGPNFTYNAAVEFNTSLTTNIKSLQVNNTSGSPYRALTLGPLSILTLTTPARVITQFDSKVVFQGKIIGGSVTPYVPLQFTGSSEFATTSDNTGFNGDLVFVNAGAGPAIITANTTGVGAFLKVGRKVQVNNNNCILNLNGANSFNGNLVIDGTNAFSLNINANQGSFGTITINSGTLSINVASAVTTLSFANSSALNWGTTSGSVVITGYKIGEIRFGTNNTGLTAAQLAKITADGDALGKALSLDANGYLVYAGYQTTWTGATNTAWTTVTNWTPATVPSVTTDVLIGTATNQPIIASTVAVNSLSIASGALLTVTSGFNLTVTGIIANNGTLTMENNANLIQVNTIANSGSGSTIVKRNSNSLFRLDYTMWSSPVSGTQTLANFSPLTSQSPASRFYVYDNTLGATGLFSAILSPSTTPFALATGYLIRMPNTDTLSGYDAGSSQLVYPGTFVGTPNNGNITLTGLALGKFVAVGNPYPSTISAASFFTGNSSAGTTLYFWRRTNNAPQGAGTAYATYTSIGGTSTTASSPIPNGTIQVGQGFIVNTGSGTTINFTNSMRIANNANQIFKTKIEQQDRIWLKLTNPSGFFSQTLIGYVEGATIGVDATDGKYINDSAIALTSTINGEEYTIQGRPPFDVTDVVALNFKTDVAGSYTIAKDQVDGIFANGQDLFLVDNATGIETNLQSTTYTFSAEAGDNTTRFSLKYQKNLLVATPEFTDNGVTIFKNNDVLHVNSKTVDIKRIQVFDIQGRLLAEVNDVNSKIVTIKNLKMPAQILVVKVTGANNAIISKKVLN